MAITKKIDPIPTAPSRSDPENFDERADAFLKRLETLDDDLNEWASQANQLAGEVNSMRNATYDYMIQAQNAKSYCMTAAANANYKGVWNSSTSYSVGDAVAYNGYIWISNYDNNVGHTPGTDNHWTWLNPLLNNSGQLTLPFSQTPILVNGQDMMNRTFYVDAVNGDDSNPGTSGAPFKTLKKAIDSVPTGGHGWIGLLSDLETEDVYWVKNKDIIIETKSHKLTFTCDKPEDGYVRCRGFVLRNSVLDIRGIIHIPQDDFQSDPMNSNYNAAFVLDSGGQLKIEDSSISVNGRFHIFSNFWWGGGRGISSVWILNTDITFGADSTAYIGKILGPTGYCAFGGSVTDNSGRSLSFSSGIAGIIRDANGVPRNIISNIVL